MPLTDQEAQDRAVALDVREALLISRERALISRERASANIYPLLRAFRDELDEYITALETESARK